MRFFKRFKNNLPVSISQVVRKKATWDSIAKKYKVVPFFRIEDYGKYKELEFYQRTVGDPHITKYKMPLSITAIVFLSKYFPDDVDFFRDELVKTFNNLRKITRK